MRLIFCILIALGVSTLLRDLGPGLAHSGLNEFSYSEPDPYPKDVTPPRPGKTYACNPLASANVFDDRYKKKARVLVNDMPSNVAKRITKNEKRLLLARASDVSAGNTDPEEFTITVRDSSYMMAEERLTLGVALLIFDVRTMKMVWSFNGQGMLGMKGETVLFQCH